MKKLIALLLLLGTFSTTCWCSTSHVVTGAEQTHLYFPLLKGKKIILFSNHTGMVGNQHLLDIMVNYRMKVIGVISPEHGFRGTADAGEHVTNSVDTQTGVPIYSLYNGKEGKASLQVLKSADILVVDIQDVGLRFYTYYISMLKLMDACAEVKTPVLVLDRPNPNGFYVDGPILDMKYKSGVGALPIPIVHGMTLGELARMINGEGWLSNHRQCKLTVIPCKNYTHQTRYELPIPTSPNLPNMQSVYLYPSTCFFEGTNVSLGRGTSKPFQQYGHPDMIGYGYSFTPQSVAGAKNPPQLGKTCHGVDLSKADTALIQRRGIDLSYVINAYRNLNIGSKFFTPFFEKLTGVGYIREMIMSGCDADTIKAKWQKDVEQFKQQRRPYLLYQE